MHQHDYAVCELSGGEHCAVPVSASTTHARQAQVAVYVSLDFSARWLSVVHRPSGAVSSLTLLSLVLALVHLPCELTSLSYIASLLKHS